VPLDKPPPGLLHGRVVEVAESTAEGREILVGQILISEEQHLIVEPCLMDCRKGLGIERAQIDALHGRSEDGIRGQHAHETGAPGRRVQAVIHCIAHQSGRAIN
jgi:hypothetical protein